MFLLFLNVYLIFPEHLYMNSHYTPRWKKDPNIFRCIFSNNRPNLIIFSANTCRLVTYSDADMRLAELLWYHVLKSFQFQNAFAKYGWNL